MSRGELHDAVFLGMAQAQARLGTCAKRRVGAVIVNARHRVRGTGHNGPAAGLAHCIDEPCPGLHDVRPRNSLYSCEAVHAEVNALMDSPDVWAIDTIYVTVSPCSMSSK